MSHKGRLVLVALTFVFLVPLWAWQISGEEIRSDPEAYVQMGYNLIEHGTMSLDEEPPYRPSMYREPIPILTSAVSILITNQFLGKSDDSFDYLEGERARYVKMQNVVWMLLLCAGAFWATWLLTGSFGFAFAGAMLAHAPFYIAEVVAGGSIDTLLTEAPAAACLLIAGAASVAASQTGRRIYMLIAGIAFGAVTLIKAVFFYVFIGAVAVIFVSLFFARIRAQVRIDFVGVVLSVCGFALLVGPWMIRNWVQFGVAEVAQRGGIVLYVRALKDQMTPLEYRGAFYVWAPRPMRPVMGQILGFTPRDLQRGGRLQRLNREGNSDFAADDLKCDRRGRPQDCIAFLATGRAERMKLREVLRAQGNPRPEFAADEALVGEAFKLIREHPGRHVAAIIPFLWRGAFLPFPLLMCALVYAVVARRYALALFTLPALGMIAFYALFSHFIMRYGVPALPVALVSMTVLVHVCLRALRRTQEVRAPNGPALAS